jgi:hypothetical protein
MARVVFICPRSAPCRSRRALSMSGSTAILKAEFEGADGSFLTVARSELRWDAAAFRQLTAAMFDVASKFRGAESIDHWIAHGFWFCDTWVREWTSHPNFPRPEKAYYETSLELLHDLAYLLFVGESPYQDDTLERRAKG